MIFLFTDFGYQGSYVGQMKAVLAQQAATHQVIDLMHDAPVFNPKASSYLLASLVKYLPTESIVIAVVDPGVGNVKRRPVIMTADDRWYVGPDNGLFNTVIKQAKHVRVWEITWQPEKLSNSFHGRDLFSPVAAMHAEAKEIEKRELQTKDIVADDWPEQLNEVIYIDHYGNAMTGLLGNKTNKDQTIIVADNRLSYARTFSEVKRGQAFWYVNSNNFVEIAVNQGSAMVMLGLIIGSKITIE